MFGFVIHDASAWLQGRLNFQQIDQLEEVISRNTLERKCVRII